MQLTTDVIKKMNERSPLPSSPAPAKPKEQDFNDNQSFVSGYSGVTRTTVDPELKANPRYKELEK